MSQIICRSISEMNSSEDSRIISGYAVVYERWSRDLGGFREIIHKGAISQELIDRSDVIMNINHDEDKMVARCVNGSGTLSLKLRDEGLYFEFEAPTTQLGDELLYNVRKRNLFECSFAFTLPDNNTCQRWYRDADMVCREINEIGGLYDCSIVTHAAYGDTSCKVRGLEIEEIDLDKINELRSMENKEKELEKPVGDPKNEAEEPKNEAEEPKNEEVKELPTEETPMTEEPKDEEPKGDEDRACGTDKEEDREDPKDENENSESEERKNKNNTVHMEKIEKRFSLVAELRNAMETGKSIDLGAIENRGYSVTDEGADIVDTDLYNILEPLRAKNVLMQAGAKYMTGLVGNVQVPIMSAGSVAWASESGAASDGSGSFTSVTLSPKRLTGKFPVSLQLLEQDSIDVENAIRQDIINAINDKLEESILKAGATVQGDFANLPATLGSATSVSDYAGIVDGEATVEAANVYGDCKYIVSPSAKAALRAMIKGENGTGMVMEAGQVDGVEALSTGHVAADKLFYGDFSNVLIGSWGNVQLDVVRDVASLANGCVTIVVNAFFDCKIARSAAFVHETL